jgi:hypothetical protein
MSKEPYHIIIPPSTSSIQAMIDIEFNRKTADRYQRIYRERAKLDSVSNLSEAYRITLPKEYRGKTIKYLFTSWQGLATKTPNRIMEIECQHWAAEVWRVIGSLENLFAGREIPSIKEISSSVSSSRSASRNRPILLTSPSPF